MSPAPNSPDPCPCACEPVPAAEPSILALPKLVPEHEFGATPSASAEELLIFVGISFLLVGLLYPLIAYLHRRDGFCVLALSRPADFRPPARRAALFRLELSPAERRAIGQITRAVRSLRFVPTTAPAPVPLVV